MILVLANITATAATIDAIKPAVAEMEQASQAEKGCISYRFTQELSRPDRMIVVEQWASVDALKEHFAAPHMATFSAALGQHPALEVDAKMYDLGEPQELPGR